MTEQTVALAEPVRLALLGLLPLFVLAVAVRSGRRAGGGAAGLLAVLAFAVLTVGFAGPTVTQRQTRERGTVVLAIDTSTSMEADDVAPRRFEAAKTAATAFVDLLPPSIAVGLVDFNGSATVQVAPTNDHGEVRRGIDGLSLDSNTAIGEAIFVSLDALATAPVADPADPGPRHIVLLSDGDTTTGRSNESAATAARRAGVPVTTIAFGTPEGATSRSSTPVDADALRAIAEQTDGGFHAAASGAELDAVYGRIGSAVSFVSDVKDLAVWSTGITLLLLGIAGVASLFRPKKTPPPYPNFPR